MIEAAAKYAHSATWWQRTKLFGDRSNRAAWLLLLPSMVLVALAFLMPLGGFLWRAVDNSALSRKLPATIEAVQMWDHRTEPTETLAAAMMSDLATQAEQRGGMAAVARELNDLLPSFRNVIMRTGRALTQPPQTVSAMEWLGAVDQQWREPDVWIAVKSNDGYLTDRYLLTTLGLERSIDKGLTRASVDKRIYADVLVRTLWMSFVVTAATLLLAYPLAYALAHAPSRWRGLVLCAIMLPFF